MGPEGVFWVTGRPRYSPRGLLRAVEGYFLSISRTVTAQEQLDCGETDGAGKKVLSKKPICNDLGQPIRYREYVVPPTVWGLCEYLGLCREDWEALCSQPRYRDAAALAEGRFRGWNQEALLTRKDVRGIIYHLEHDPDVSAPPPRVQEPGLSLSARRRLLEAMGAEDLP